MGTSSTKCGNGTTKLDGVCNVDEAVCGPGTAFKNEKCIIEILSAQDCNHNIDCNNFLGLDSCDSSKPGQETCTFCPGGNTSCSITSDSTKGV